MTMLVTTNSSPWGRLGGIFFLLLLFLASCSKEASIDVQVDDTRYYFEPKPEMMDEESQLRRAFYQKYDIHLLFNDTLRHDSIGQDFNGDTKYFTELLDIYYSVGSHSVSQTLDFYKYIPSLEQKLKATKYLETQIQPHLSDRMRPFSWLLVNEIQEKSSSYAKATYPYAITGERGIAIALSTFFKLSESRVPAYTQQILNIIAVKMAKNNSKALDDFYEYSKPYYDKKFAESTISNDENTRKLREAGCFSRGKASGVTVSNGMYPDKETDLADFVRLSLANNHEKMVQLYGEYPLIVKKDSVIRQLLEERGFVYNPEIPTETVTDKFYNVK